MAETITLTGVDAAPAQTWNWLGINDTTLEVAPYDAEKAAEVQDALPEQVQGIALGAGTDATAWVDGTAGAPALTTVEAGQNLEKTIVLDGGADGAKSEVLMVEEDGRARLAVVFTSNDGAQGTCGHNLRILAGPRAQVEVDMVMAMADGTQALDNLGAYLDEDASLKVRQYVLGTGKGCVGFGCDLAGDRSQVAVDVRYVGRYDQAIDLGYDIRQHGRRTEAVTAATGVLTGNAKKSLRTAIDLVKGCKGAHGQESETVLVAGDGVVNKTLPVILCSEDDVQGDHGATIGSLSPEQLFYLGARGLSADDAVDLMGSALVDDAAATLPTDAAEAVVEWARWNLGTEAAEGARIAQELAHVDTEEA